MCRVYESIVCRKSFGGQFRMDTVFLGHDEVAHGKNHVGRNCDQIVMHYRMIDS